MWSTTHQASSQWDMKTSMSLPELGSCGLPLHSEPSSIAFSVLVDQDEDCHGSLGSHMLKMVEPFAVQGPLKASQHEHLLIAVL